MNSKLTKNISLSLCSNSLVTAFEYHESLLLNNICDNDIRYTLAPTQNQYLQHNFTKFYNYFSTHKIFVI